MPDVEVRIAQAGLLAEVTADERRIAQSGLLAEVTADERRVAFCGLMVEVYESEVPPAAVTSLFCQVV